MPALREFNVENVVGQRSVVEDIQRKVELKMGKIYIFVFVFMFTLGTPASQGFDNTYIVAAAAFGRGSIP